MNQSNFLSDMCLASDFDQANAGDSRVVLSIKGEVKPLSFDHKPGNECP